MKYNDKKHVDCIINAVCNYRYVSFDFLVKTHKNRNKELVLSRYLIMYFLGEYTNLSTTEIANKFNKDHSTYIHCVKSINNWKKTDKRFLMLTDDLSDWINKAISEINIKPFYDYTENIIDQSEFVCL